MELNFHHLGSWEATDDPCWEQCDKKGGKCSICGESGYCCRNEDHPTWNGDCPAGAIQAAFKEKHRCILGEKDRKRRDIDVGDRYDREDPCRGVKQLTTGFANWVERYIPNCSGQRDHSHQINRLKKWGERLQDVMQCDKIPKCLDAYPLPRGYKIEETDFGEFVKYKGYPKRYIIYHIFYHILYTIYKI